MADAIASTVAVPTDDRRPRAWLTSHAETTVNVIVIMILGVAGFVGSAGHVLELAESHGQHGTGAWTIVGTVEVLAAYTGWQVSRREGWRRWVALAILTVATVFTIAANLAASTVHNCWGYILAVTPAFVFVAAVVLAETSTGRAKVVGQRRATRRAAKAPAAPATPVASGPVEPPAKTAATAVKPQVEPQISAAKADPKAAVLAVMTADNDMGMGEIVLATGLARSTAKKAVSDLRGAGQIVTFGDPAKPRYVLASMAEAVAR